MLANEMTIESAHISFKSQKPYFNLSFGKDLGNPNYSNWFIPGQVQREEKQSSSPLVAKEQSRPKAEAKRNRGYMANLPWMCLSKRLRCITFLPYSHPIRQSNPGVTPN